MRPNALVYCEGSFRTPDGKTAHGVVRNTTRYNIVGVVDSSCAGSDAGEVLDGRANGMPIYASIGEATRGARQRGLDARCLVIGLAPIGGMLSKEARGDVKAAIELGLDVHSGLHRFLSDDPELHDLARERRVQIHDIRKTPSRDELHYFNGKIWDVTAFKIAVLGTDSCIGKRTTAWSLKQAFEDEGRSAQLIGTGQTSWAQGAEYSVVLDSLILDFVTGEIEHAVWRAWKEKNPEIIIVPGQGGLLNPAAPGGAEIFTGADPDVIVLQHAPGRKFYDGFPTRPMHSLAHQIRAIETLSGKPVVAITVNNENIPPGQIETVCQTIEQSTGIPAFDPLRAGCGALAKLLWARKRPTANHEVQ